jgi:hypothetical protein
MHQIEIREQHGNLMFEVNRLLRAAQLLMEAATGRGPLQLVEAKEELTEGSKRLAGIAMRIG